jgi:hypothetical protein
MPISLLFLFLIIAALAAVWAHHANLSRHAVALVRQHLHNQDLQFLDQSAVLCRLRLVRGRRGGWCWQRQYRFEFSSQGDRRYQGWITLNGRRLSGIELQPFRETPGAEPLSRDPTIH